MKIGINGLGRIGRCLIRALVLNPKKYADLELVAVNGTSNIESYKHLVKYDSIHGVLNCKINANLSESTLTVGTLSPKVYCEKNPNDIPWDEGGVSLVFECTGKFNSGTLCSGHFNNKSVKKTIISAPAQNVDKTIVYGVNEQSLTADDHIISAASCTTNALAPILKPLNDHFTILSAFATTVHAYTSDQNLTDGTHKDLRRSRAAATSMIPTTTGATKTIEEIIPELKGRISGSSVRVPVPNVSLIDLCFTSAKCVSKVKLHDVIMNSCNKHVVGYSNEPLVSCDFIGSPYSCVVDLSEITIIEKGITRLLGWYDNEWAFALRMLDIAVCLKNNA